MTLAEWADQSGVYVGTHNKARTVAQSAVFQPKGDYIVTIGKMETQLWRLDDYRVSSVTGGTIWLTKKNDGTTESTTSM